MTSTWGPRALVIGPVAFVTAWAVGGAAMVDYSPIYDAISRIAAVGAPYRGLMTVGFVVYGVAMLVGSRALAAAGLPGSGWAAAINGLATLAVAATPLDYSATVDGLHNVAATIGYASLAAIPGLAVGPLRAAGRDRAARGSAVCSVVIVACLVTTPFVEASGAFQRAGLTMGDLWLVVAGLTMARARLVSAPVACT